MRKSLSLLLAAVLCLAGLSLTGQRAEAAPLVYQLGDRIEDFTVTTYDGQTVTLSALLAEKDMVLLNIWATWCPPCQREFPAMEEAYQRYADRVAVVALSCEPTDTDEVIASFAAEYGMTFYVGRDEPDLMSKFAQTGIPVSVVIDRNGVICFIECGSMPEVGQFTALFDVFVGDDYSGPVLLTEAPLPGPSVEPVDAVLLADALETGHAANPVDAALWPWLPGEKDGRTVVKPSNGSTALPSAAAFSVTLDAARGDAVAVTAKVSTSAGRDTLSIQQGEAVLKRFSGEMDWFTYAIPVEANGPIALTFTFDRTSGDPAASGVWIDSVALLSGEKAAAALAANPVYPAGGQVTFTPATEGVRAISVTAPDIMRQILYSGSQYIVNGDEVTFRVKVDGTYDPDASFLYVDSTGEIALLRDLADGDGYVITSPVDRVETSNYSFSSLLLYRSISEEPVGVTFFANEANANIFFDVTLPQSGISMAWAYAEAAEPAEVPEQEPASADYLVRYVDEAGAPVPGVLCQVCDDSVCVVYTSDEDGCCAFSLAPFAWEIHTLRVPAGYTADTAIRAVPPEGGELVITLTRE